MKIYIISALMLSFVSLGLGIGTTDIIKDERETYLKPSINPNNVLYCIKRFYENLSLKLTLNKTKKIEKLSLLALKRLTELEDLNSGLYADHLFITYMHHLEHAYLLLQELALKSNLKEELFYKLENKVRLSESKLKYINNKAKTKIDYELKYHLENHLTKTKMSLFNNHLNNELLNELYLDGYSYLVLVKLQAISDLTLIPIRELLMINHGINFEFIIDKFNINKLILNNKIAEYNNKNKCRK